MWAGEFSVSGSGGFGIDGVKMVLTRNQEPHVNMCLGQNNRLQLAGLVRLRRAVCLCPKLFSVAFPTWTSRQAVGKNPWTGAV